MKRIPVILGSILLTASCSNFQSSDNGKSNATKQESEINFSVGKSALNLTDETSYVSEVELVCPDYSETITLSEASQSAIVYRNIADCALNLKKFVVTVDGSENEYSITNRTSEGRNVYDAIEGINIIDTKLAEGSLSSEQLCTVDADCDFKQVDAHYTYSELLSEDITLINDLSITELSVDIEKELAPSCVVVPSFVQDGYSEPRLEIAFSQCENLFDHNNLELSIFADGAVDLNIEDLHALISSNPTLQDASGDFTITLTLDDLKSLGQTTDVFTAVGQDFGIAIRNKDGKSLKYYLIDNNCTVVPKDS